MKQSAFSKKEELPSISSRASSIGLRTTEDFTALWSLPERHYQTYRSAETDSTEDKSMPEGVIC
jgi:hypothetical protein